MVIAEHFSIKVIGSFDIIDRNGVSVRPSGRKDCALIAMLAITRTHRQTRSWLQEKLWGDRSPAQGAASLRQSLTTLRGVLNNDVQAIYADRTWVWLDSEFFAFDHIATDAHGEILRGLDLREEGFNEWLRESRAEFSTFENKSSLAEKLAKPGQRWYFMPTDNGNCEHSATISDFVCSSLVESLSVVGLHPVINQRGDASTPPPRATDMVVRAQALRIGSEGALSVAVTNGFGSLQWQVRREVALTNWADVRTAQTEIMQLFQDYAIRTESHSLRGAHWSATANGCQALMGIVLPGSVPLREIVLCSEAAIAEHEKGVYHALLGFAHLLLYGERESLTYLDTEEVMKSFRTALNLSPANGIVQALAGHSYGFLLRDIERNEAMTREAVRLLPSSGVCWTFRATSLVYCGRYAEAVCAANNAVSLTQGTVAQPKAHSTELFARLMAGDTTGAIRAGEISLEAITFRPTIIDLMTAYALEKRTVEGREKLDMLMHREPDLSVELLKSPDYPIVTTPHRAAIVEAAHKLGLT